MEQIGAARYQPITIASIKFQAPNLRKLSEALTFDQLQIFEIDPSVQQPASSATARYDFD